MQKPDWDWCWSLLVSDSVLLTMKACIIVLVPSYSIITLPAMLVLPFCRWHNVVSTSCTQLSPSLCIGKGFYSLYLSLGAPKFYYIERHTYTYKSKYAYSPSALQLLVCLSSRSKAVDHIFNIILLSNPPQTYRFKLSENIFLNRTILQQDSFTAFLIMQQTYWCHLIVIDTWQAYKATTVSRHPYAMHDAY